MGCIKLILKYNSKILVYMMLLPERINFDVLIDGHSQLSPMQDRS